MSYGYGKHFKYCLLNVKMHSNSKDKQHFSGLKSNVLFYFLSNMHILYCYFHINTYLRQIPIVHFQVIAQAPLPDPALASSSRGAHLKTQWDPHFLLPVSTLNTELSTSIHNSQHKQATKYTRKNQRETFQ